MIKTLSHPLKIQSKHYKTLLTILNSNHKEARIIGGCVRDSLLGYQNEDIDIATNLPPVEIILLLARHNIKTIPTGIKYGTVSAFIENEVFEITTLRKDINSVGRHTDVSFDADFKQDAARRDFTINALSYCPFTNKLYDYFNGYDDLMKFKVKFIGDAKQRINEDYLRILRFFRFSCRYAKKLDEEGLEACSKLKDNLNTLSKERIIWEINKLLLLPNSPLILSLMHKVGILQLILPIRDFEPAYLENIFNIIEQNESLPLDKTLLLAKYAVILWQSNIGYHDLINLRLSNNASKEIIEIIKFINNFTVSDGKFLLNKIWFENKNYLLFLISLLAVNKIDKQFIDEFITKTNLSPREDFVITGNDLTAMGFKGRQVGINLEILKDKWIASDFKITKGQLINLIKFSPDEK